MNKTLSLILIFLMAAAFLSAGILPLLAQDDSIGKLESIIKESTLSEPAQNKLIQEANQAVKQGIPARELRTITERHLAAGMEAESIGNWFRAIIDASSQGLPVSPVIDKIKEGIAKNIPVGRIEQALKLVTSRLTYCRDILQPFIESGKIAAKDRGEAVEVMAETLWRGTTQESLKQVSQYILDSRKQDDTFGTIKVSALALGRLQSLNVPPASSMDLIKDVINQPDYRNDYLYDLVEIIRIAVAQKKRSQGEIVTMVKNSVAKNIKPAQLADMMQLGTEGLTMVQRELTVAEQNVATAQKQVDDASAKAAQGLENAKEELERAREELKNNLERMKELKELMERMREEIEHLRYYRELYGE